MPRPAVPSRRADILAAARDAFGARGFAGTRMDDIARTAGISKAALYLQFASKEDLFEALVIELIEAMLPATGPTEFGNVPAAALLRGLTERLMQRLASREMAFVPRVIIGEGMNFPELVRFYHERVIARGLGVIEKIIRHGIERGEFACADPHLASRSVIGGMLISAIWRVVFEPVGAEPIDPGKSAAAHADTILNGLLVRKDAA